MQMGSEAESTVHLLTSITSVSEQFLRMRVHTSIVKIVDELLNTPDSDDTSDASITFGTQSREGVL